jgi:sugar lactone lactonase YvrE
MINVKSKFWIVQFLLVAFYAKTQIITTVAGTGTYSYSGDGGPAVNAQLNQPKGVAVDPLGNIYIADYNNSRIRLVNTAGNISTFAGNGSSGSGGDGGPATSASFAYSNAVAIDASGNVYITDAGNNRVRKINSSGIISTFAGNGTNGFGGDGGAATSAQLNNPIGLAVDANGNVYIADAYNHKIRKVNTSGVISTYVGTTAGFSGDGGPSTGAQIDQPTGIAIDKLGNLYIADNSNNRIRKVNSLGIISTIAGTGSYGFSGDGGNATNANLANPNSVAADTSGNIYFSDYANDRVRKISKAGIISTLAGTFVSGYNGDGGLASNAELYRPEGVAVDLYGNVYIADKLNHRIRKVAIATDVDQFDKGQIIYSMYPNPASSFLAIEAKSSGEKVVAISNVQGERLYIENFSDKTRIDLTSLPEAMYILMIQDGSSTSTSKLLITR